MDVAGLVLGGVGALLFGAYYHFECSKAVPISLKMTVYII